MGCGEDEPGSWRVVCALLPLRPLPQLLSLNFRWQIIFHGVFLSTAIFMFYPICSGVDSIPLKDCPSPNSQNL